MLVRIPPQKDFGSPWRFSRNGIRTESCAFGISSACCANGAFVCFCRASLKPGAFEPAHRRSQKEKEPSDEGSFLCNVTTV